MPLHAISDTWPGPGRPEAPGPASAAAQHAAGPHCLRREPTPAAWAISGLPSLPDLWAWAAQQYGDALAIVDRHRKPTTSLTFSQLHEAIQTFAAGLSSLGVRRGERVALFTESSGRWLVADAGIMAAGAVDAVRGVDSISTDELRFILESSEAPALVVQDAHTLERLLPEMPDCCTLAVVLWGDAPAAAAERAHSQLVALSFDQLMERGQRARASGWQPAQLQRGDLASLAFTSGTSGKPKGVMTSQENLVSQLEALDFMPVTPGDTAVSYLPPWHSYGRTLDYFLLSRGCKLHYSRLRDLKQDLVEQQPDIFVSVPLLLDNLHDKALQQLHKVPGEVKLLDAALHHVRAQRLINGTALEHARAPPGSAEKLAATAAAAMLAPVHQAAERGVFERLRRQLGFSRTRWVVSGGGSLTPQTDDFYEAIGVPVVVGYGLTETSPVLTIRHLDNNIRGTIGPPLPRTGIRIAAPHNPAEELPDGQQGLIMASGPQVMQGYWNNAEATEKAFPLGRQPDNGWLDTGAWLAIAQRHPGRRRSSSSCPWVAMMLGLLPRLASMRPHVPCMSYAGDLGWRVPYMPGSSMGGHIVITGRQKDTIVLANGENVEPQPLEDLLCTSPYIQFAVLVGSGKRALGALLVPSQEALDKAGEDVHSAEMHQLMQPFAIEDGTLTRTMKPRKATIFAKYAEQVAEVGKQLR
ncbi:hypothetical protein ABPG75_001419 [Micractinium tetrahymenae]